MHRTLVRGEPDVRLDPFLLLERASVEKWTFDCLVTTPAFAKCVLDIERRLIHGLRFFRANAHR